MNYLYKQSIIVRSDIDFKSKGKLAAQVAHASLGALLKYFEFQDSKNDLFYYNVTLPPAIFEWIKGDFAKIVLKIPTLHELLELNEKAKELKLPHALITDNGTTVFNEPTITCLSIGPWYSDIIDNITKDLKLL